MAYILKKNILNVKNPNTGKFESVPMMVGESAYQIAVRHGYTGSEEDWLEHIGSTGGGTISGVATKAEKADALDLSEAVGGPNEPVYFNGEGKPISCGVTLGSAAVYNISDDPNETNNAVMTSVAMQSLINDTIPDMIGEEIGKIPSGITVAYNSANETLTFS